MGMVGIRDWILRVTGRGAGGEVASAAPRAARGRTGHGDEITRWG